MAVGRPMYLHSHCTHQLHTCSTPSSCSTCLCSTTCIQCGLDGPMVHTCSTVLSVTPAVVHICLSHKSHAILCLCRYDPRINSAVTLSVNEKVPFGRA